MTLGSEQHALWKRQQEEKQRAFVERRAEWIRSNGIKQGSAKGPASDAIAARRPWCREGTPSVRVGSRMRRPSTPEERWSWWERSLSGENPPVHEMDPQAGFYAVRKFRYGDWARGPMIPARVWWVCGEIDPETGELMSPDECRAEVDGIYVNPWSAWTWLCKKPISESEWNWLKAQSPLLPGKPPQRHR